MRNLSLSLLTALVALAQPLVSHGDDARLMVSAVVLPNARCSFAPSQQLTGAELAALAAAPSATIGAAGALRCAGYVPAVRTAQRLTQLSVSSARFDSDSARYDSDFVLTITP